eukprot:TRINITY_DN2771_c0_g1_i16.p1 TRINITY_DN2771_c0_g1~~TRINITY_DN2771_c0_g1_i16.p1  ORF type:complete len:293 (-),score=46.18 TRINITY_DN2771_c0_g1_i16:33-794(-)
MAARAIELLALPKDRSLYILDIGCGSGLSGDVLDEEGHVWVGCDISPSMLDVAVERGCEGDLFQVDMGQGVSFRPGVFDGCISISALQWLCNADRKSHVPKQRLLRFFETLYSCLARGSRAVFQFYPENPQQMSLITQTAMQCGFCGGLVVDYPNSAKAKKFFLCLFAGPPTDPRYSQPKALGTEEGASNAPRNAIQNTGTSKRKQVRDHRKEHRVHVKSKEWIASKKDRQRRQGKEVRPDSKYTGRKRKPKF